MIPGSTSIRVTTTAIAAMPLRTSAPRASARTASSARYRPAPITVRGAPPSVSATAMPLPAKTWAATRKATSADTSPTTPAVAATTRVLAPRTAMRRCGGEGGVDGAGGVLRGDGQHADRGGAQLGLEEAAEPVGGGIGRRRPAGRGGGGRAEDPGEGARRTAGPRQGPAGRATGPQLRPLGAPEIDQQQPRRA